MDLKQTSPGGKVAEESMNYRDQSDKPPVEHSVYAQTAVAPPVYGQPAYIQATAVQTSGFWQAGGLCDCCQDCRVCWLTLFCPCVTFGMNINNLYSSKGIGFLAGGLYCLLHYFTGCCCLLGMVQRKEIRDKYNLPSSPMGDCCLHCCCHPCGLCQEARELKIRRALPYPGQMAVPQSTVVLQSW